MTLNASEIRVAGSGRILVAAANTPIPGATEELDPDVWQDLGFTNEEGVTFTKADSLEAVASWQHTAPVRLAYSEREFTLTFALMQVNQHTLSFFFGDRGARREGDVIRAEMPGNPRPDERALLVEFTDEATTTRFVVPRGVVTESEDVQITRSMAVQLGLTFQALAPYGSPDDPMAVWLTHDPAGDDGGQNPDDPALTG